MDRLLEEAVEDLEGRVALQARGGGHLNVVADDPPEKVEIAAERIRGPAEAVALGAVELEGGALNGVAGAEDMRDVIADIARVAEEIGESGHEVGDVVAELYVTGFGGPWNGAVAA